MVRVPDFLLWRTHKVRAQCDLNLSAARSEWGIFSERLNMKIAKGFLYGVGVIMAFLFLQWSEWLFVIMFSAWLLAVVGEALTWYWDDLAWAGSTIKPGDSKPRPFWPSAFFTFDRHYSDMPPDAVPETFLTEEPPAEAKKPKPERYGLIFTGDPEGYPRLSSKTPWPHGSDVIVFPIPPEEYEEAEKFQTPIAERKLKKQSGGSISLPGVRKMGVDYIIDAPFDYVLLGQREISEAVDDVAVRQMLEACPEDIRDVIYQQDSRSKWWRRVYICEASLTKEDGGRMDLNRRLIWDNKVLRARAKQQENEVEHLIDANTRLRRRLGQ